MSAACDSCLIDACAMCVHVLVCGEASPRCTVRVAVLIRTATLIPTQLRTKYVPWALRCGRNSVNLMNVDYERHFELKLDEFRRQLRFEPFSPSSSQPAWTLSSGVQH